jgi:ribonucleotide monophosphatase NagD (HAD superfamily)
MIEECVSRLHIDVSKSFIIGDSTVDVQTGKNAGLKTLLVRTGQAGLDRKYDVSPDWICLDVKEAVRTILELWGNE